ncbi:hypothetical protein FN976_01730 [Caenimonas sedimenti]|uniref:Cobalt-zinc-cadmium resistance protein n=1 Tax=Caenimonas sedimenti TaxID=2596921 RepID=A0A562ZXW6_9BURK|nr:hypothetical protein [Caenimonas sedimenti]TWO72984.1 hypothetical protein FN976_01730 [Caenimonas sedimenti]
MRRFLLLLLAFVLPLQMSWAAAHFCDDEKLVAHAVAAAEHAGHDHGAQADEQSDAKAEKIADACCGAAHGCHGLHHLMGQADLAFLPSVAAQMPAPSGAAPPLGGIHSRIERPNWLAA